MKRSALFGSVLSFLGIVFLAMAALPATPEAPSPNQTKSQQALPQPQVYDEAALKKMKMSDLKDMDLVEIRGVKITGSLFKARIRRQLKIADPANPVEVAEALNSYYNAKRYESKQSYDETELARMTEDIIAVVFGDQPRAPRSKSPDSTRSVSRKPVPPPVAQKSQNLSEPVRPQHLKQLDPQAQNRPEFIDLRSKIESLQKDKKLEEGDHLIHTSPSGLSFTARVEGGRIIGWVITDKLGREVTPADNACWSCRESEDETQCYMLPCPKR